MKVLFVGSINCMPEALESELATHGLSWALTRTSDGKSALQELTTENYSVVLAESQLNDMTGTEVLSLVANTQPKVVRILLDRGDCRIDMSAALMVAHRILAWPPDVELLIDTLSSIAELNEFLNSNQLLECVGGIGALPPAPRLYMALGRALSESKSDAAQIAALVEQDPAISAKVLQVCKSAYFVTSHNVANVRAAITRLGMQTVRSVVLASEVFSGGKTNFDRDEMQRRAMFASTLARRILPGSSHDLAATGALLSEVGLLVPGVIDERNRSMESGSKRLGHCEAGAGLLGLWGLPLPIVEAVYSHRSPHRLAKQGFWVTGAVHVAVALAAQEPVNEDYLRSVGVLAQLPTWRQMAEELRERENPVTA